VTQTYVDRSWLKYSVSDLDIAAIEVAIKMSESQSFILPQGSCHLPMFRYGCQRRS